MNQAQADRIEQLLHAQLSLTIMLTGDIAARNPESDSSNLVHDACEQALAHATKLKQEHMKEVADRALGR